MTARPEVRDRPAARVLLVDGAGRVLLFRGCDPTNPDLGTWWFTPGGGLDRGETPAEGAARELREETGLDLRADDLGSVVHERVAEFRFAGEHYRQVEDYFLARVDAHDVDTSGFSQLENDSVLGHRWWPREELRETGDRVYPVELPDLLDRVLA